MGTIQEEWKAFIKKVNPKISKDTVQYCEMKKSFYAGATVMLLNVKKIGDEIVSEDAGVIELEKLWQECLEFVSQVANEGI